MLKINNIFYKIDKIFTNFAALTLLIMMLWIVTDVLLRAFFNSQIVGTIEITGEYLLLLIVYLSLSYTYREKNHVSVDFIIEYFPRKVKTVVKLFTNIVAMFIFSLLAYANFQKGLEFIESNARTTSLLNYTLAPALMIITVGVSLLIISILFESIAILRGGNN